MKDSTKILLGAVLIVGAGIFVYKKLGNLFSKAFDFGQKATAPLSNAIADTYVGLTQPPPVQVLGQIQLPDGTIVAVSDIANNSGIDDSMGFTYNGRHYTLGPRDVSGNYQASAS